MLRTMSLSLIIIGGLSALLGIVSRLLMAPLFYCELVSRSFGLFAGLLFLAAIALNTLPRRG